MRHLVVFSVACVLLLSGCGISKDPHGVLDIDPGLDGCVSAVLEGVTAGPVRVDKATYHRINEKCKDMPINPVKE